jgi:hypothetical protein
MDLPESLTQIRKHCFLKATQVPSIPALSGQPASFDLPFVAGLFPLFLENGIWANDPILGGAVTLPAKNLPALGLSNYDVTFFAAFGSVDNAGSIGADGKVDNDGANLFGVTTFIVHRSRVWRTERLRRTRRPSRTLPDCLHTALRQHPVQLDARLCELRKG